MHLERDSDTHGNGKRKAHIKLTASKGLLHKAIGHVRVALEVESVAARYHTRRRRFNIRRQLALLELLDLLSALGRSHRSN